MYEVGNKSLDSSPPHVYDPEDTTPVLSMANRKDGPSYLCKDLSDIIYQDYSYHDNFHHDYPNIDMYNIIGYKFIRGYNGIPQREIVKDKFYTWAAF